MVGRRAEPAGQRRERPFQHPRAEHTHGTRAAYVRDRCRCPGCTAANTAASRAIYRARAYGRWQPYLDATGVRVHLQALRQAGIGVHRIAALTGTPVSHVRALAGTGPGSRPPVRRVRPQTAERLLALTAAHATPAPGSRVPSTGTRRRLQALVALGWPLPRLAAVLGHRTSSLSRSMTAGSVTAATDQQVRHLYHRLTPLRPPQTTPAQRAATEAARAHAQQQGWLPPLGWDDIDTDPDPGRANEQPDDVDPTTSTRSRSSARSPATASASPSSPPPSRPRRYAGSPTAAPPFATSPPSSAPPPAPSPAAASSPQRPDPPPSGRFRTIAPQRRGAWPSR